MRSLTSDDDNEPTSASDLPVYELPGIELVDDDPVQVELAGLAATPAAVPGPAGTPVSVHLVVTVGGERKTYAALAVADANGYRTAKALISSVAGEAGDWAIERQH